MSATQAIFGITASTCDAARTKLIPAAATRVLNLSATYKSLWLQQVLAGVRA